MPSPRLAQLQLDVARPIQGRYCHVQENLDTASWRIWSGDIKRAVLYGLHGTDDLDHGPDFTIRDSRWLRQHTADRTHNGEVIANLLCSSDPPTNSASSGISRLGATRSICAKNQGPVDGTEGGHSPVV